MSHGRKRKRSFGVGSRKRPTKPLRGRRVVANHVELKFLDVDLDDALLATGGTVTPTINIIAQGVTESERVGRKCILRKIQWRYTLMLGSFTNMSTTADSARLILYQDKQANGATAAVTDILETANYHSFNNLSNSGRFRILMDRTHDMKAGGAAGDGTTNDSSEHHVSATLFKEVDIPLEFSGANGVIGEIRSNNIGVLAISHGGLTQLDSKFRLRFSDS